MNIIESFLTKNPCYTAGKTITVKGLMLHSVGCSQPSAQVFVDSWNKSTYTSACVHAFIDGNTGDVYQTLPWNRRGWHCGSGTKGSGNDTHIGVEMCEPACITYTSGSSFTCSDKTTAKAVAKRTYEAAVELFAYLCEQYGLDPTADGVIISHKEGHSRGIASDHGDPEHLWNGLSMGYTMDTFRAAVAEKMGKVSVSTGSSTAEEISADSLPDVPFTVQVIIDDLNIRDAASMSGNVVGQTGKGVFTITAVSNGWGKLKSGAGWIYLLNPSYCTVQGTVTCTTSSTSTGASGTQATEFADMTNEEVIAKVGPLATADMESSGVLASVTMAQFILESGYGKSELAQNANNCFGMKKSLSGNTWSGSTWDGTSVYTKTTKEENSDGSTVTETADFRKYDCVEDSIADHSAYLLGAKNGSALRYDGIAGMTDYTAVAQLIKDGGYATSSSYVSNLCSLIEQYDLTQYDGETASSGTSASTKTETMTTETTASGEISADSLPAVPFTVKVIISNLYIRKGAGKSYATNGYTGIGTFTITEVKDGWGKLKSGAGWIYLLNPSYCTVEGTVTDTSSDDSYLVKVTIDNLCIRKGPGTNYSKTGKYTGKGTFTIVKTQSGTGSTAGWGLLKSYADKEDGWISLDYATKV